MNPLTANAAAITMLAFTPTKRVIVKSSAAARSASPITVRRKNIVNETRATMLTTSAIRSACLIRRSPIVMLSTKKSGSLGARGRGETVSKAMF
jgi:hypothetical protein